MVDITGFARFLRRHLGGAAGAPATLGAGQPFMNEAENVLYVGIGDDGAKNSTAQLKVAGGGAFVDLASAQTVAGKKTFGVSPAVPNGAAAGDAMAFGQLAAALAAYATTASPAFTGSPSAPTPTANDNSNLLANTAWVQALVSAVAAGLTPKPTAAVATAAALPAYAYANAAGTLTAAANGALTVDGYAVAVNDIVLVNQETGAAAPYNGLYVVTATGSATTGWALKRHVDMALASEFAGAFVPVGAAGATTANTLWLCNPTGAFTLGTTAVPFTRLNSPTQLVAGAGIALSGNTISVPGYGAVAVGSLLKMTATGLAAAVAGTDYVAPFSAIDPGTA